MDVIVLDITNRNPVQYNPTLCRYLALNNKNGKITLLSTNLIGEPDGYVFHKLLSIVPKSIENSRSKFKRVLRAIEVFVNYIFVIFYVLCKRPDILHIQWLPFIEISNIEVGILGVMKFFCPKLGIYLTAHNVYPHDISGAGKIKYRQRFKRIDQKINGYLVHLENTKLELVKEFCVDLSKLHLAYHGIYESGYVIDNNKTPDGKFCIVMYGFQNRYKGTDIFIEAFSLLPDEYKNKLSAVVVGRTDAKLYNEYSQRAESLGIKWINRFVSDEELYSTIGNSDLILLPYRSITQSGVLLLALSYRKPILTSDLISFKETLEGYPDDYFFETGNPQSLADILIRFVDGGIDIERQKQVIEKLNIKYSWNETAKNTLAAYMS